MVYIFANLKMKWKTIYLLREKSVNFVFKKWNRIDFCMISPGFPINLEYQALASYLLFEMTI